MSWWRNWQSICQKIIRKNSNDKYIKAKEELLMNTQNTLIALAYVRETDNPLEVFCNYILICLLEAPERKLRHDELCEKVEEKFGIKIPHHMMKMCCRILGKTKKISKLAQGAGYLA